MKATMGDTDQRHLNRDSLFVMAGLRLGGTDEEHRIKVRNLSSGGLMAEAPLRVTRGMPLEVEVRNIGWVAGSVAWVQDNRFGIAFAEDIDARAARMPVQQELDPADFYKRKLMPVATQAIERDTARMRKI